MNAEQQRAIVAALAATGLRIQRPVMERGNRVGWEPVLLEAIVGEWLRRGWQVRIGDATEGRVLRLDRNDAPA